jgi:hypothetical protein
MERVYRNIIEVINERANKKVIDYYHAVKIVHTKCEHMQKHFDNPQLVNLNKFNKVLWSLYKIIHEVSRIKVVNENPDERESWRHGQKPDDISVIQRTKKTLRE